MEDKPVDACSGPWWHYPPLRNALIAGMIAGLGLLLYRLGFISRDVEILVYLIAIPLGGHHWAREGVGELIDEREIGIEILMLFATLGAILLGLWDEAAALVVLYAAAEGLEEYTYSHTRTAIRALLDLVPREARLLRDGKETLVPAERLEPGDQFVIRPGETLVTDGVIIEGESSLDEATITGEALPVDKGPGDPVYASSINQQGALVVGATRAFSDNSLARIIDLVERAQSQKGRAQQWIERFGRRYSPLVLLSALLLILIPWFMGLEMATWLQRSVVLLVAAAPCALIMSIPVAMAASIGAAGKRGILIKGGVHLEHLSRIRTIAFDKTGTLTRGQAKVTDVIPIGTERTRLLAIAAGLEGYSEHPLARRIVAYVQQHDIEPITTTGFLSLPGNGVQARIAGEPWFIGNPALFRKMGSLDEKLDTRIQALRLQGKTVLLLGNANAIAGIIALQDSLREGMEDIVQHLKAEGLRLVMLTGDNIASARDIAERLAIDEVRASLQPEDKVTEIRRLQDMYGPVLMIGDGVNDAPALAAADCSIAMGAAGSDAAIEAADVALMADDLAKVLEVIRISRKAMRISRQNIIFAIAVLTILIPTAVAGMIGITLAVIIHEASELLAVANGLRAGTVDPDR